ncbi:MAG: PucR family transcriptional regulator [Acidimicrobiales bacterium]
MLPTVAEVLLLDVVRHGRPRLLAGKEATSNPVRWVHVSELADIAHLLRGGELVLTTGVALPEDPGALARYVSDLAEVQVAGLVVELGRRFRGSLPPAMVGSAERATLPLIALSREVAFVRVTEAVHGRIIDSHLEELRRSEALHAVFTELSLEGATASEVLAQVARLGRAPVVLEDLAHQVVAIDPADRDPGDLMEGWEGRSRAAVSSNRVDYLPEAGLLVSRVGARGEDWGRLVLVCDEPPSVTERMLVERATTALAFGRLIERDRASVRRQAERTLLAAILEHDSPDQEVTARSRALGVPMQGRQLVGVTACLPATGTRDPAEVQSATSALAESVTRSTRRGEVPTLIGVLEAGVVSAVVSLSLGADVDDALLALARRVRDGSSDPPVVAAGSVGQSVSELRRSLRESRQVLDVARDHAGERAYHRLGDLGILGLLHLLRDDPRLQSFVERQLGPLLARELPERARLLQALSAHFGANGNKSTAAARAHVSRSVLYERLARVEAMLGVDLDDPQQAVSLHVAMLSLDDLRSAPHAP